MDFAKRMVFKTSKHHVEAYYGACANHLKTSEKPMCITDG
jgi:hypothetical protein